MPVTDMNTKEDFKAFVGELQAKPCFRKPLGWGIFRQQSSQLGNGKVLTGTYPVLNWQGQNLASFACYVYAAGLFDDSNAALWRQSELVLDVTPKMANTLEYLFKPYWDAAAGKEHPNVQIAWHLRDIERHGNRLYARNLQPFKLVIIFDDVKPTSLATAYMKLTAHSRHFVKPRELNVDGILGLLPNVAWSGNKAIDLEWLRDSEVSLKMTGEYPVIDYVDWRPPLLMHIIPEDGEKVSAGSLWGGERTTLTEQDFEFLAKLSMPGWLV